MFKKTVVFGIAILFLISGCGSSTQQSDTGSIAFSVDWRGMPSGISAAPGISMAPLDCTTTGVYQVSATVYNSSNTPIAAGGPWACTAHGGSIASVPVGSGYRVVIKGVNINADTIVYGSQAGVSVSSNTTSNVGTITASYITILAGNLMNPVPLVVETTDVIWAEYNTTPNGAIKTLPTDTIAAAGTILVSGLNYPSALAADTATVYWGDAGGIHSIPRTGGTPTTLAAAGPGNSLAVDSTNIFWVDTSGGVMKAALTGGPTTSIAQVSIFNGNSADRLVLDSTSVYWTEYDTTAGKIRKVAKTGGAVATLASNLALPLGIAVDATDVYWSTINTIQKVGISGGTPTVIASASGGQGLNLAIDAANVYWADRICDTTTCYGGVLKKVSINGGAVTWLAPVTLNFNGYNNRIAVDSTSVYWTEAGTIRKVLK